MYLQLSGFLSAKEEQTMKQKLTYMGAGVGIVLFALFGLLPGSFLGGVMGLNLSSLLFGAPVEPGIFSRIIIVLSMLTGVLVSGLIFVTGGATLGWLAGYCVDAMAQRKSTSHGSEGTTHEA